ncbi:cyclophane-forming radical SAM/SPASM peptide maturase GrrM/OscB [Smaragdicoccus niigatensis]|uniref:cyclophane-forming radical SAM/SPASM peptide maturase GrrM/OscB n=1 Tax=Smaragdicoccus niigatensis TaxID=359359 RepID=UPI001FDEE956|nr:cyclophane-forming radical SAM/SPASM peptide maturase GrrM/OscB [Smaragdicoccus niigatensis]
MNSDGVAARPRVRLAILQPTSHCNLNCVYCYVPERSNSSLMSDAVVRAAAVFTFSTAPPDQESFTFAWHAGEPLAAGIEFYRRAFRIIADEAPGGSTIRHLIQTNATLVNASWCEFFSGHQMEFGVSLDGPRDLHDSSRVNWAGRGSFDQAMRGVKLLRDAGYNPNAICVLTPRSLDAADELYDFFAENAFPSVGFNLEESEGAHARSRHADADETSLRSRYTAFMRQIWKRWYSDRGRMRIREIEQELGCIFQSRIDPNFVAVPDEAIPFADITIRRDGEISTFSPEFASTASSEYQNFVIGNVLVDTPDSVTNSTAFQRLSGDIEKGRNACQKRCSYYRVCGAGFQSNRYAEHGNLLATETVTCRIHKMALNDTVTSELNAMSNRQAGLPSGWLEEADRPPTEPERDDRREPRVEGRAVVHE